MPVRIINRLAEYLTHYETETPSDQLNTWTVIKRTLRLNTANKQISTSNRLLASSIQLLLLREFCSSAGYNTAACDTFLTDYFRFPPHTSCGPGSSVGIATDYGLDGPGSNSGGDEIFRPSRPALGPNQPPVQWVPVLSRVKCGRGMLLTSHPLLVQGSWKSRAIPLPTLWTTPGL